MTPRPPIAVQQLASACRRAAGAFGIPLQAVYLHGSWATEFARADSDIDLGLLAATTIDPMLCLQLAARLQREMDNDAGVDIADLRRVDTVFAAHVVSEGRVGILADIRQRGTIYGAGALA